MTDYQHYILFDRIDSVEATEHGLLAHLHGEQLRLDVVANDVARVKISRGGVFDEAPTFAVNGDPLAGSTAFQIEQDDEVARLSTEAMTVSLWLDPFRLDVHRADGSPVVETAADKEGRYWAYATLNDAFTLRRTCQGEDAIFGLGEKAGRSNRKGRDFTLWNTDVLNPPATREFREGRAPDDPRADFTSAEFDPYYVSIPFFYHQSHPSGAVSASFIDCSYRGHYDFTERYEYRVSFAGGQYTEYIFAGPDMARILTAFTELTGRMALPPIWALGYHQCRWYPYAQSEFEELAERLRSDGIPCDVLWMDIEHMDGYKVFTFNEELFPDLAGMLSRLSDQGFGVVTIVDPGLKYEPGYPAFDQGMERDVLCKTEGGDVYIGQVWPGGTVFPDFATDEARAWWGELTAAHVARGLVGVWNDMNEPATGVISPDTMLFGSGQYSHERFHNQYALLMAMSATEGMLAAEPDRRTFVLSRSGFAGIQRYAANWMGDNQARWDHLALNITMGNGFGISGQPFVGADIGGFQGYTNAELFLRWMQCGVLTPFCRNHSEIDAIEQYPWTWGETIEGHVREAIELRYRLLPYIYTSFVQATDTGAPVQRPLVFDFQRDARVRDLDDEYLFGPDLLVAPVLAAGITARNVYLPEGEWYDWHSGESVGGSRHLTASTPLDRIPIYVRAGAVIPMWPEAPGSTRGYRPEAIELHLFVPAADGVSGSELQEDDGLTFAASRGGRYRTTMEVTREGSRISVTGSVAGDGFPEFAREAFHLVVHGADPASVLLDGRPVSGDAGRFVLPNRGEAFTVTFEV